MLEDILKDFAKGSLEIFFPKLRLVQNTESSPEVYEGSGLIRLSSDRVLSFVLFSPNLINAFDVLRKAFNRPLGRLIPQSEYFSLSGTDIAGRVWESDHVHVETSSGPGGTAAHGKIQILRHQVKHQDAKNGLKVYVLDNVEIPCAEVTTTADNRKSGDNCPTNDAKSSQI